MKISGLKRFLLGKPLSSSMAHEEKIPKWRALAVLSSDALSSVAYATEEILIPLSLFSLAALAWSIPIGLAIVVLLILVSISYSRLIGAYPNGGGAYVVAKENLGLYPALIAGAALLIEYALTVAVSISAGVRAISSAFPVVDHYRVEVGVLAIILITIGNLRGIRESSFIFAIPTYLFIVSLFILIGVGFWNYIWGAVVPVNVISSSQNHFLQETYPVVPLFLILKAFSSGCSALTGIEAISNSVPSFKDPAPQNARITLAWMAAVLTVLFFGTTAISHIYGIVPDPEGHEAAISILTRSIFGQTWFYYLVQAVTAMILMLAANTCYNGFPWLSAVLARDRFLPRQLAILGDKLVFSNSILGLSLVAAILLVIFEGRPHALIPLYAIGVFIGFTLSQFGMVKHFLKEKKGRWKFSLSVNMIGGIVTTVVAIVIATAKFKQGAWVVFLLIAFLVFVFLRIHEHYLHVGNQLSLVGIKAPPSLTPLKHTAIVPISGIHRGVIEALRYALSISDDVRACYVEITPEATERMQEEWNAWAHDVPLIVIKSPFRSVIDPILNYIDDVEQSAHGDMITVIIPEFVTKRWWHSFLHNQTAIMIRAALMFRRGKVVTSVRYHLRE